VPVVLVGPSERPPSPPAPTAGPDGTRAPVPPLRCALVNNMPDAALADTERQFVALLDAGAGARPVEVRRYCLPGPARAGAAGAHLAAAYLPLDGLWADGPDAVIVTGAEPQAGRLADEPFWDDLVALLDRATARPVALLLSCLAAHAALAALDGIGRVPLGAKCSGVFPHRVRASTHTLGMGAEVPVPHSRHNDVPTAAVAAAGWDVLLSSPVGWGAVAARRGRADMLLVQGHPEYAPTTLLREWRRDLRRHTRGERPDLPSPPVGVLDGPDRHALDDIARAVGRGAPVDDAAFDAVAARAGAPWRPAASVLVGRWLDAAAARAASGAGRDAGRTLDA
jgi:homoserine O-succinyltransferase